MLHDVIVQGADIDGHSGRPMVFVTGTLACGDSVHFGLRLRQGDTGAQPADHGSGVVAVSVAEPGRSTELAEAESERRPRVDVSGHADVGRQQQLEIRR